METLDRHLGNRVAQTLHGISKTSHASMFMFEFANWTCVVTSTAEQHKNMHTSH